MILHNARPTNTLSANAMLCRRGLIPIAEKRKKVSDEMQRTPKSAWQSHSLTAIVSCCILKLLWKSSCTPIAYRVGL